MRFIQRYLPSDNRSQPGACGGRMVMDANVYAGILACSRTYSTTTFPLRTAPPCSRTRSAYTPAGRALCTV